MTDENHPFEARYAWLDRLPARLLQPTVTHVHGPLVARGKAILTLREALLAGEVPRPETLDWPEEHLRKTLIDALTAAGVAPYCNGNPQITEDILLFVLQSVEDAHRLYDRALVAFHTLARKDTHVRKVMTARDGACSSGACNSSTNDGAEVIPLFDEQQWEDVRRDAAKLACELINVRIEAHWSDRVRIFKQMEAVFAQLSAVVGLPPGSERGILRALARDDLLEMRWMLSQLPALENVVRLLGRMRETSDPSKPTMLERIGKSVQRLVERERQVEDDHHAEIRGIERSAEVSRMLSSEAALLTHPMLRKVWLVRWTEHGLLTYHAPGVLTKRMQEKQTFEDGEELRHSRAEHGPILVILDTSGSMTGLPETVAKAIIVQLVGVAFMEKRPCYVYNFSGPGDLIEQSLSFEGEGLTRMLAFVSLSFHGGTDIDEAMRRACERSRLAPFRQADIAVISDGYFELGQHILSSVRDAKKGGALRIHGIRIGQGDGFAGIGCDTIHDTTTWIYASSPFN